MKNKIKEFFFKKTQNGVQKNNFKNVYWSIPAKMAN